MIYEVYPLQSFLSTEINSHVGILYIENYSVRCFSLFIKLHSFTHFQKLLYPEQGCNRSSVAPARCNTGCKAGKFTSPSQGTAHTRYINLTEKALSNLAESY